MFCLCCGKLLVDGAKYCCNCGAQIPQIPDSLQAGTSALSHNVGFTQLKSNDPSERRNPSYEDFLQTYATAEVTRQAHYKTKVKSVKDTKLCDVKIGVAMMNHHLRPVYGSKFFFRVSTNASRQQLLSAAVKKKASHDKNFDATANYMLLYQDTTPVVSLPESGMPFTLKHYKDEMMEDYAKLKFYLISSDDYARATMTADHFEDCSIVEDADKQKYESSDSDFQDAGSSVAHHRTKVNNLLEEYEAEDNFIDAGTPTVQFRAPKLLLLDGARHLSHTVSTGHSHTTVLSDNYMTQDVSSLHNISGQNAGFLPVSSSATSSFPLPGASGQHAGIVPVSSSVTSVIPLPCASGQHAGIVPVSSSVTSTIPLPRASGQHGGIVAAASVSSSLASVIPIQPVAGQQTGSVSTTAVSLASVMQLPGTSWQHTSFVAGTSSESSPAIVLPDVSRQQMGTSRDAFLHSGEYQQYVGIFSEDDVELETALATSFSPSPLDNSQLNFECDNIDVGDDIDTQNELMSEILMELGSQIDESLPTTKFNIARSHLWEGARRTFMRKSYNPRAVMSVKFTDDCGISEGAVDVGGPRREFLTLLMHQLANDNPVFVGEAHSKHLTYFSNVMDNDDYFVAGIAVAVSLVHGGPAPAFLSDALFNALVHGPEHVKISSLEELPTSEMREKLQLIQDAKDADTAQSIVGKMEQELELAGTYRVIRSVTDRDKIVLQTAHWVLFGRNRAAFERFQDGLKILGILDAIRMHPSTFRHIMCHQESVKVNADIIGELLNPAFSETGSNLRTTESLVYSWFLAYLQDMEDDDRPVTLPDLLFFTTGCRQIPPTGFLPKPSLQFLHTAEADGQLSKFPKANTCECILRVPVCHKTYEEFKSDMNFGILSGQGFGYA